MGRYIRKRLLQAVPVVFGITILTFFIMKMAPGGPLTGMISPRTSSESLQRAREALGLNDPIIVQYWNWLKQLVQGNFGYSWMVPCLPLMKTGVIIAALPEAMDI